MKKWTKLFSLAIGALMAIGAAVGVKQTAERVNAESTTYTMTIDSSASGNNNVHWTSSSVTSLTYDDVVWTTSVAGTSSFNASKTYAQIGSKSNPASQVTISTTAFAGKKITFASLTGFCMSNTGPSLTVTAGETTIIDSMALAKTDSAIYKTADSFAGVTLESSSALTYTINSSAKAAICISEIKVIYEEPSSPTDTLEQIVVSSVPNKTTYQVGESFDPAGLTVTGTYSKSGNKAVTSGIEWTVDPETFTSESDATSVTVTASVGDIDSEPYTVNGIKVTPVMVSSINVSPSNLDLAIGGTQKLTASVLPANAANKTYTWSTSNSSVATVSNDGTVTGVAAGECEIYATANDGSNVKGTCSVKVTKQYEKTFDFTKIDGFSSWTTSYMQHVVEYTEATVTFGLVNKQNSTITNMPVGKGTDVIIKLKNNKKFKNIYFGCQQWNTNAQNIQLYCSTDNGSTYGERLAESSDFELIQNNVGDGVNCIKFTTTESKQIGFKIFKFDLAEAVHVNSVSLDKKNITLKPYETETLVASILPANADDKSVTWTSNNNNVATVENGVVTGVAGGNTVITVTTVDGSKTDTCEVTVEEQIPTELVTQSQLNIKYKYEPDTLADVIEIDDVYNEGESYNSFSSFQKESQAVYAGRNAMSKDSYMQFRSKDADSGIYTTASGGKALSVSLTFGIAGNRFDIYGSNSAYTTIGDLFDSSKQGTLLGSLTNNGTVEIEGEYEYVAIRTNDGSGYLSKIEIEWDVPNDLTINSVTDYALRFSCEFNDAALDTNFATPANWQCGFMVAQTAQMETTFEESYENLKDYFEISDNPIADVAAGAMKTDTNAKISKYAKTMDKLPEAVDGMYEFSVNVTIPEANLEDSVSAVWFAYNTVTHEFVFASQKDMSIKEICGIYDDMDLTESQNAAIDYIIAQNNWEYAD